MLRPTMSPGLYVQMVGRGTRLCDGKDDCLVLACIGSHDDCHRWLEKKWEAAFDLAAVKQANQLLVATIEDSLTIAERARAQRADAAVELDKAEAEIRRALMAAKAIPPAPKT
jgi:superfamily II DNA or RNA helicase